MRKAIACAITWCFGIAAVELGLIFLGTHQEAQSPSATPHFDLPDWILFVLPVAAGLAAFGYAWFKELQRNDQGK